MMELAVKFGDRDAFEEPIRPVVRRPVLHDFRVFAIRAGSFFPLLVRSNSATTFLEMSPRVAFACIARRCACDL